LKWKEKLIILTNKVMSKKEKVIKPMTYVVESTRKTTKTIPKPKYQTNKGYLCANAGETPEVVSFLYARWNTNEKQWGYWYLDADNEMCDTLEKWLDKVIIK